MDVRSSGVLKLPWRPYIRPYDAHIVWKIGDDGLVEEQFQTWSISAAEVSFFSSRWRWMLMMTVDVVVVTALTMATKLMHTLFEYRNTFDSKKSLCLGPQQGLGP